ncbi:MAG TPA: hypothetical protein VFN23_01545 [Ktedonobacteraceae bacterium]|nr:hypothetical protein [Ktedonobacteraceae bacterium]
MQGSLVPRNSYANKQSLRQKQLVRLSKFSLALIPLLLILTSGLTGNTVRAKMNVGPAYKQATNSSAVLTYKKDRTRTGQFSNETNLTPGNVNVAQFGKRVSYPVDGQVYAEPLYIPNLSIKGTLYNVVIVATQHDSIYAFDADQTSTAPPLWHTSFLGSGITSVPSKQVSCDDIAPEYGITSTPVIDRSNNTLYVVANTMEHAANTYRLHAINITTGLEKQASTKITATTAGNGLGSVNGKITFNPVISIQRTGLLLANAHIFLAFAAHCDNGNYHGWIMSYDSATLKQTSVYNVTPGGFAGGVWESGAGLAADAHNHIYVISGNGSFSYNIGGKDLGQSFIKLDTTRGILNVLDAFTPFNQTCLNIGDHDVGSGGAITLPDNELLGVGKEGRIYLLNQNHLGGFTAIANPCSNMKLTNIDKIIQETPPNTAHGGVWGTPAYWNGSKNQYVYVSGVGDHLKAFKFVNGKLSLPASSQTSQTFDFPGANPVVSSNANASGTGIVWTLDDTATLRAFNAEDLSDELYNSKQNGSRDKPGSYVKFSVPTIANGEVFVGTKNSLVIYGELA